MCLCVDRLSYDIAYWMKVSPNGAELYQVASETWFTEDGIAFGWDRTNQSWSVLPDRKCVLDDSLIYKPKVDFPIITDIRGLTRNQINRVVEAYEILGITRRRGDAVPDTAGILSNKTFFQGIVQRIVWKSIYDYKPTHSYEGVLALANLSENIGAFDEY